MMRRDGGNVVITITEMEFASLLIALGHAAMGSRSDALNDSKWRRNQFLRLANSINVGNPTFTPYAVDGDPVPAPPPAVVSENMTSEEHRSRHAMLHRFLDELVADWIQHNPGKYPSSTPVMDLMKWSHSQTKEPDAWPVDPAPAAPAGGGE